MLEKNIQKSLPIVSTSTILFKGISEIPKKLVSLPVKLIKVIPKTAGQLLMVNEPTIKNYFKLGRLYILKKLVLLVALILALAIAAVPFITDFLQSHDFTKVIVNGSPLHKSFDGKARLVDSKDNKQTLYIGEFKNGKYEGIGTEYFDSGEVKYTGGFKNGKYEGSGISYFEDKAGISYYKLYEGDFKNNSYDGNGIEYFDSGKIKYEGEFKNNKYEGNGISYVKDSTGNLYCKLYEGAFKNGSYEGKGIEYFNSGNIKYEGEFKNGEYSGIGKLLYSDGNLQYDGSFYCGSFDGMGVKYSSEGYKEYEGGFKKGKFSGEGTEYNIDGTVLYKGFFSDNKYNGIGTLYNEKLGDIYKGYFKDGNPFYQGFLGISEAKLKEIVGDPDKPADDVPDASSGATNDITIDSMPMSTPMPLSLTLHSPTSTPVSLPTSTLSPSPTSTPASAPTSILSPSPTSTPASAPTSTLSPSPASTPVSAPASTLSPTSMPTEEGTTLSYVKYAMEFIMKPLSSTQKIPVVQVVRISGENTVLGISCGMSYKDFKDIKAMKDIEMSISHKADGVTLVNFTENEYIYALYFNNTTDSLEYIEIETENIEESS